MHENSALTHIRKLTNTSVNCSQLDVELLMMHVLNLKKNELYRDNPQINDQIKKDILSLLKRREDGEPLAYIINTKGFRNLELYVDRNVLVPRPETEIMVQTILDNFGSEPHNVIDLGTGSGAIGLSLSIERNNWDITCTDISIEALKVAKRNMISNSLKVNLVNGHWLEFFQKDYFDIIVSNPPYLSPNDPSINSDGLKYEPVIALVSESEGLKDIEKIINESSKLLSRKGCLFIEHGNNQSKQVCSLFKKYGFSEITSLEDLNGDNRFCSGRL